MNRLLFRYRLRLRAARRGTIDSIYDFEIEDEAARRDAARRARQIRKPRQIARRKPPLLTPTHRDNETTH